MLLIGALWLILWQGRLRYIGLIMMAVSFMIWARHDRPLVLIADNRSLLGVMTDQGRAHKLESIKAFIPCRCNHKAAVPVLEICEDCGTVEEHDGTRLLAELSAISAKSSFNATRHIVEVHGRCRGCTS